MSARTLDHNEVSDELPSYVLGDLDAPTTAAVAAHLAACPACRDEERRLADAFALIGTLAPAATPPPQLRERFLAALDEPERPAEPVRLSVAGRARSGWFAAALSAAATVILALAALAGILQHRLDQTRSSLSQTRAQLAQMNAILAEPGRVLGLTADPPASAYGVLYLAKEPSQAVLAVDNLPPTPPGRVYRVWLISGDRWAGAGQITVGADGRGQALIAAPSAITGYDSIGVTAEMDTQAPAPGGPVVIRCHLNTDNTNNAYD